MFADWNLPIPKSKWVDLDSNNSPDEWQVSRGELLERKCDSCAATHKTIVYKRLTSPGKIDFKKLFLDSWESNPPGGSNILNTDFALYSSRDDAKVLSSFTHTASITTINVISGVSAHMHRAISTRGSFATMVVALDSPENAVQLRRSQNNGMISTTKTANQSRGIKEVH